MRALKLSILSSVYLLQACLSGSSIAQGTSTIYAYLAADQKWCVTSDLKEFKAKVKSDAASQFEVDQAEIQLQGQSVTLIKEFRTDENAEWSTLISYSLSQIGDVKGADALFRNVSAKTDHKASFEIKEGRYIEATGATATAFEFRKAASLSSFPFAGLIPTLQTGKGHKQICGTGTNETTAR
jgi:hypothetical protein